MTQTRVIALLSALLLLACACALADPVPRIPVQSKALDAAGAASEVKPLPTEHVYGVKAPVRIYMGSSACAASCTPAGSSCQDSQRKGLHRKALLHRPSSHTSSDAVGCSRSRK